MINASNESDSRLEQILAEAQDNVVEQSNTDATGPCPASQEHDAATDADGSNQLADAGHRGVDEVAEVADVTVDVEPATEQEPVRDERPGALKPTAKLDVDEGEAEPAEAKGTPPVPDHDPDDLEKNDQHEVTVTVEAATDVATDVGPPNDREAVVEEARALAASVGRRPLVRIR